MKFPKIDVSSLPDLDTLTGAFGSLKHAQSALMDDTLVILMTYIYDAFDPRGLV